MSRKKAVQKTNTTASPPRGYATTAPPPEAPPEEPSPVVEDVPDETPITEAPPEETPDFVTSTVTVTLAPPIPKSESHRVHIDSDLKGHHGAMFKRLRMAMNLSAVRLRDGRFVQSNTDALKYLMECFEDGLQDHE